TRTLRGVVIRQHHVPRLLAHATQLNAVLRNSQLFLVDSRFDPDDLTLFRGGIDGSLHGLVVTRPIRRNGHNGFRTGHRQQKNCAKNHRTTSTNRSDKEPFLYTAANGTKSKPTPYS